MSLTTLRPTSVRILEVGPRDGLQNETNLLSTAVKTAFIEQLADAGLKSIEAGAFVDPSWVPQMADAEAVFSQVRRDKGVHYSALVPNESGLERALAAGVDEVAVFASATETFSRKNLNRSREQAMVMFKPVVQRAKAAGKRVRAYISMAFGDPWEGDVPISDVVRIGQGLLSFGADELCIADTIGIATPALVQRVLAALIASGIRPDRIAAHFHDTYGQGLANVLASLELQIETFDASAGGIGGCPYAKSATGNLATEDLLWMLEGLGVRTGVDLKTVVEASTSISRQLGHEPPGRVARALAAR